MEDGIYLKSTLNLDEADYRLENNISGFGKIPIHFYANKPVGGLITLTTGEFLRESEIRDKDLLIVLLGNLDFDELIKFFIRSLESILNDPKAFRYGGASEVQSSLKGSKIEGLTLMEPYMFSNNDISRDYYQVLPLTDQEMYALVENGLGWLGDNFEESDVLIEDLLRESSINEVPWYHWANKFLNKNS